MHLIYDVNLLLGASWRQLDLFAQFTYIVYTIVASGVDFDYISVVAVSGE